jgi:signal transduction histidine kinase/HAMP domain-containing protein
MQFTVRSLGGKLIILAMFTLLFCLLLMMVLSWGALKLYAEDHAQRDAQTHLVHLQQAYQSHTQTLIQDLEKLTQQSSLASSDTQQSSQALTHYLQGVFAGLSTSNHITTLDIISSDHQLIAGGSLLADADFQSLSPEALRLIDQTQGGNTVTALMPQKQPEPEQLCKERTCPLPWHMYIATPLHTKNSILLESFPLDNTFAQVLAQQTGENITLCITGQIVGTSNESINQLLQQHATSAQQLCQTKQPIFINTKQHNLIQGQAVQTPLQSSNSAILVITTMEPLYNLSLSDPQSLLIILGLGIFVFALGIIIYTFTISVFLIRPLRRLQALAHTVVASNTGIQITLSQTNEITTLANSFNLLSDSLYSESQALAEQMSHLLVISDALMSTLNLEQLLGEFALRIGSIMKAHHVSLLLYGRERDEPWAVAQWTPPSSHSENDNDNLNERGHTTVHVDPDGDITMAVTTKMVALPTLKSSSSSGKRVALRATKLAQPVNASPQKHSVRQPRIPRSALRDIDLSLARMAIQRQKIVYAEDIAQIYQERQENWAHRALESGYRSVIAVPLILREQPIGVFILYTADSHPVSSRDTFLLSTAAMQTSIAIQNAMLYAEVKDKNAALERVNHLKSQFLANVTHELRTPLHSIISYGSLLVEGFVDGDLTTEQAEHIQFMVRRAEDLSHLVDDMLDLSKIEADRIEVKPEPLAMKQFLMEVINQLKPIANNKGLSLLLEIEEGLPPALADSHRLRQVMINLVSNALKFTDKGGVTIRCNTLRDHGMLSLSVTDTGIGITPAALSYIFEAFRQADGSTTRRFGGTGLGLTIAKKLIELQGGEIAVESAPGEGTTFTFTLPSIAL